MKNKIRKIKKKLIFYLNDLVESRLLKITFKKHGAECTVLKSINV